MNYQQIEDAYRTTLEEFLTNPLKDLGIPKKFDLDMCVGYLSNLLTRSFIKDLEFNISWYTLEEKIKKMNELEIVHQNYDLVMANLLNCANTQIKEDDANHCIKNMEEICDESILHLNRIMNDNGLKKYYKIDNKYLKEYAVELTIIRNSIPTYIQILKELHKEEIKKIDEETEDIYKEIKWIGERYSPDAIYRTRKNLIIGAQSMLKDGLMERNKKKVIASILGIVSASKSFIPKYTKAKAMISLNTIDEIIEPLPKETSSRRDFFRIQKRIMREVQTIFSEEERKFYSDCLRELGAIKPRRSKIRKTLNKQ